MSREWKKPIFRRATQAIAAIVVALFGLLVWSYFERVRQPVDIAVLQFHASPRDSALADTVRDSLSGRLGRIRGFNVRETPSIAGYSTGRDSAHAIATALGVRYLVVGWVSQSPAGMAPDRITIRAWLIDTQDSPPTNGEIVTTPSSDLCPGIAMIAVDIAGHFARAPRGALWGPGGATGCAVPPLERRDDPSA